MIFDKLVSLDVAATVTGGTTLKSVDVVDLGAAPVGGRKLGTGEQLFAVFHILNNTGGDAADTMQFAIQTDDNSAMSSAVDVAISRVVTGVANLPAGSKVVVPIPPGIAFERYITARYAVTATAVLTVTAYLTNQKPADTSVYPDAI